MIFSLDTEDNGDGKGARLIVLHDGENYIHFRESRAALEFISLLPPCEIFCVNMEYDLINLFLENEAERRYLKFRASRSKIFSADFFHVTFRDTLAIWPNQSVAAMGAMLKLPKLDAGGNFINLKYCARDAEITIKFILKMYEREDALQIVRAATVGSRAIRTAAKATDTEFYRHPINREVISGARQGYYGGRTECFKIGDFNNVHCIDINSAYPWAMSLGKLPGLMLMEEKGLEWHHADMAEVKIKAPRLSIQYLPRRQTDGLLVFPFGEWTAIYTKLELVRAEKLGYEVIKTRRAWRAFGEKMPIQTIIRKLYNARKSSTDTAERLALKYILNSTYGKFGAANLQMKITHETEYVPDPTRKKEAVAKFGFIFEEVEGEYPAYARPHYAALITALVRDKLFNLLTQIKNAGGEILYCDTDSVIWCGKLPAEIFPAHEFSDALGNIKVEFENMSIKITANKFYIVRDDKNEIVKISAKGSPVNPHDPKNAADAEAYITGKAVTGKRPGRIRSKNPNEWRENKKQATLHYRKGTVDGGIVKPLEIMEG